MHFLEGMQDKKTAFMICGFDAVLVFKVSVPKCLEISLHTRFGILCDRWVVLVKGGVILVERDCHPRLILVG